MSEAETPRSYEDRRRAPRYETRADAVAALGLETQIACIILDINDFGARIEFAEAETPADVFYLVDSLGDAAHRVRVVWRKAPMVGVRFLETWLLAAPNTPAWLVEIRGDMVLDRARARGMEVVWSRD